MVLGALRPTVVDFRKLSALVVCNLDLVVLFIVNVNVHCTVAFRSSSGPFPFSGTLLFQTLSGVPRLLSYDGSSRAPRPFAKPQAIYVENTRQVVRVENPFYQSSSPLVWLCRETRCSPMLGNIKT